MVAQRLNIKENAPVALVVSDKLQFVVISQTRVYAAQRQTEVYRTSVFS